MSEERVQTFKPFRYVVIALLLAAFFGGLYLNALNHRYKTIGGVVVMDTWTKELLVPDSFISMIKRIKVQTAKECC